MGEYIRNAWSSYSCVNVAYISVQSGILLGQQSRFGSKLLGIEVGCPQNETAAIKGSRGQTYTILDENIRNVFTFIFYVHGTYI